MFLFCVLSFFKKGDSIQGETLFKGEHYLRKYGIIESRNEIAADQKKSSMQEATSLHYFSKRKIYFRFIENAQ